MCKTCLTWKMYLNYKNKKWKQGTIYTYCGDFDIKKNQEVKISREKNLTLTQKKNAEQGPTLKIWFDLFGNKKYPNSDK